MRRLLLLVLCLALLIAACGDNGDETASEDDDTEETEGDGGEEASGDEDDEGDEQAEGGEDWPDELVFALTASQESDDIIDSAEPLADLLEERLDVAIEPLVPTDYAGVIVAMASGEADIAGGAGPVQMTQLEDDAGADLILQSQRFGEFVYVSQWFTNDPDTYCENEPVDVPHEDDDGNEHTMLFCNGVEDAEASDEGPIGEDSLANAEGATMSYVDEGSTSGFLYPALQLMSHDIDPLEGVDAVFAGGHPQSVSAVYEGDADIGVSYNDARQDVLEEFPDVGEQLVVFAWSDPIPNDGFAVRGDLPEDLKQAITDALLEISETEEGAQLLNDLYSIDALTEVDPSDFDVIRDASEELDQLLEE